MADDSEPGGAADQPIAAPTSEAPPARPAPSQYPMKFSRSDHDRPSQPITENVQPSSPTTPPAAGGGDD